VRLHFVRRWPSSTGVDRLVDRRRQRASRSRLAASVLLVLILGLLALGTSS
jgi:hypothetical protein